VKLREGRLELKLVFSFSLFQNQPTPARCTSIFIFHTLFALGTPSRNPLFYLYTSIHLFYFCCVLFFSVAPPFLIPAHPLFLIYAVSHILFIPAHPLFLIYAVSHILFIPAHPLFLISAVSHIHFVPVHPLFLISAVSHIFFIPAHPLFFDFCSFTICITCSFIAALCFTMHTPPNFHFLAYLHNC